MSYSSSNQFFPQSQGGYLQQPPPRRGSSCLVVTLMLLGGGGAVFALLCCGSAAYLTQPPKATAAASQPFTLDDVPLPIFPDRKGSERIAPKVIREEISLGESGGYYAGPGLGGKLLLYLPEGKHRQKSLPCVLITGAGSDLLSGMSLSDGDNPEHLPYAQAGYAVLAYELDGPSEDNGDLEAMRRAYEAFRDSRAGLVNARNALEFVLEQVPEVDPERIYAAGHSSAATHALLFAAHEPRLAGVIAYAPAVNVPNRFGAALRALAFQMPGVVDFATQSSPHTHQPRLKCRALLFHAADDDNCPIAETQKLAADLKQQGTEATLTTVAKGGHYNSMIEEGIPAAIKWLRDEERKQ